MGYELTDNDVAELLRLRQKLDNIRFVGMEGANNPDSLVIGPPPVASPQSSQSSGGGFFPVNLTSTGGSNGNKTTAASYVYTAKTLDNATTLGTSLSPQRPRPNGTATTATLGSAYYDSSGTLQLYEALEKYGTGGC